MNLYFSYMLNPWVRNLNTDFTLKNCLFEFVKLSKSANPDKYKILATAQHLILVHNFHLQTKAWEKMSLFLEMI